MEHASDGSGPVPIPARLAAQPPDLRRRNLSVLLHTLLSRGPTPRAELAQVTGLAPGTVTKLTAELLAARVVHEQPVAETERLPGRPRVPVAIDRRHLRAAGVHIGLLRTTVGLVDLTGAFVDERQLTHRSRRPENIIRQAAKALRTLIELQPAGSVLGVGASVSGMVDPATGVVPEHEALGWRDVSLRDGLAAELGLPVVLDSTMRALPLAEARFGGRGSVPTLLHVFVGNVVGAAVLVDGKPLLGTSSAAGYIDHLPTRVRSPRRCTCGRNDCLAATASDVVLVEDARARGLLGHDEGLDELLALATAGNRVADRLLRRRAELAGGAIALLVDTLDPHVVILGGGLVDDPRYLPDIRAAVAGAVRRPLAVPAEQLVHATSFGPHAVMFSSAALYLDTFYRDPAGHLALTRS